SNRSEGRSLRSRISTSSAPDSSKPSSAADPAISRTAAYQRFITFVNANGSGFRPPAATSTGLDRASPASSMTPRMNSSVPDSSTLLKVSSTAARKDTTDPGDVACGSSGMTHLLIERLESEPRTEPVLQLRQAVRRPRDHQIVHVPVQHPRHILRVHLAVTAVGIDQHRHHLPGTLDRLRHQVIVRLPDRVRDVVGVSAEHLEPGPIHADQPLAHRLQGLVHEHVAHRHQGSLAAHSDGSPTVRGGATGFEGGSSSVSPASSASSSSSDSSASSVSCSRPFGTGSGSGSQPSPRISARIDSSSTFVPGFVSRAGFAVVMSTTIDTAGSSDIAVGASVSSKPIERRRASSDSAFRSCSCIASCPIVGLVIRWLTSYQIT